jgi:hypothetical protein
MGFDMTTTPGQKPNVGARDNFDLLVDIEVLFASLACFISLLDVVYYLIKHSKARDIFIYNFIQAMKVCQKKLPRMFIDGAMAFSKLNFQ